MSEASRGSLVRLDVGEMGQAKLWEGLAYPTETFRLIERSWQPFQYSDKKASLGKMHFGGKLAYQGKLEFASGLAVGVSSSSIHSSWKEVVMLGSGKRNQLVEGFFCLA